VSRPRVTVYTRARCGLCRSAEAAARREARRADVQVVDVDTDPRLVERYGVRVPVVVVDGVEVAELEVSSGAVRAAVRRARRRGRGPWFGTRSEPA
jgi:glutaredoxin